MRSVFVVIIGILGLMGLALGQSPSSNATKKLKWGLGVALGAHREFLGRSTIDSPTRTLTYIQHLNWGWRVQVGVVADYGFGMSRFGIRMGLAVGLRRVDFGWLGVLTNPLDSASIPVFLRFDKDQLELLADMKLALRYQGQSKRPWVGQVGAFLNATEVLSGRTSATSTNLFEPLVDGAVGETAFGAFAQVSKRFPIRAGILESTIEVRWRPERLTFDSRLNGVIGMVGLNFWPKPNDSN